MRLTGGEIVVEYLIRQGVPFICGIPGHGNVALLDAVVDRQDKIRMIQVMHEQSGVHLADAYYRVSGRPLCVTTSIGPGATNTVIGIAQAYVDSTAVPLLPRPPPPPPPPAAPRGGAGPPPPGEGGGGAVVQLPPHPRADRQALLAGESG